MSGKFRIFSKKNSPRTPTRRGLLYSQSRKKAAIKKSFFKISPSFGVRIFSVIVFLSLLLLFWPKLIDSLMRRATSDSRTIYSLSSNSEYCNANSAAEYLKNYFTFDGQGSNFELAARDIARHCEVDVANISLVSMHEISISLERARPIFAIDCGQNLARILTEAGSFYNKTVSDPWLPMLWGFDRKFCRPELRAIPVDTPEAISLLTQLKKISIETSTSSRKLLSVSSRMPRGYELRFSDMAHSFVLGSTPSDAQIARLRKLMNDPLPLEPTTFSLDLADRIVIKQGVTDVIR